MTMTKYFRDLIQRRIDRGGPRFKCRCQITQASAKISLEMKRGRGYWRIRCRQHSNEGARECMRRARGSRPENYRV